MESTTDVYQYDELPPNMFRYLVLFPGIDSDPLECSLHTATVEETHYEAVSYVWGTNHRDNNITCDGKLLKVTPNLHNVLKRVRLSNAPRNLWADSICINQGDIQEKGRQVTMMGQIYQNADRVLICVGSTGEEYGPSLRSLLKDVCQMIEDGVAAIKSELEQNLDSDSDSDLWDSFPHLDADAPIFRDHRWASMNALVEREWFQRGWVVREAGLAKSGLVIWGQTEFSWNELMGAIVWRHRRAARTIEIPSEDRFRPHLEAYEARHQNSICMYYQHSAWAPSSLLDYMHFARNLQLTDPRDRIYAFLDLATGSGNQLQVVPNYNDPPLKVYHDFAAHYIRSTGDVGILNYVKHGEESLGSEYMTWAPNWAVGGDTALVGISTADNYPPLMSQKHLSFEPEITSEYALNVRGVIFDSVQYVSDVLDEHTTTIRILFHIWNTIQSLVANPPYRGFYSFGQQSGHLEAFLDALCAAEFCGDERVWRESRMDFVELFQRLSSQTDGSSTIDWKSDLFLELESTTFFKWIATTTSGKRAIVTRRGYIGYAPRITRTGDSCGIVFGCPMPCFLREAELGSGFYFLGPGFVLGGSAGLSDIDEALCYIHCFGVEESKEWTDWGLEEQDMCLV